MAYNEELARQRRLDHYRNHLERQVVSQHRYFVLLLGLANVLIVASPLSGVFVGGNSRAPAFFALLSLIIQAASMLIGCLSHRRELSDLNFAEKQGTWPDGREQRMYYAGRACMVLNFVCFVLSFAAAFIFRR